MPKSRRYIADEGRAKTNVFRPRGKATVRWVKPSRLPTSPQTHHLARRAQPQPWRIGGLKTHPPPNAIRHSPDAPKTTPNPRAARRINASPGSNGNKPHAPRNPRRRGCNAPRTAAARTQSSPLWLRVPVFTPANSPVSTGENWGASVNAARRNRIEKRPLDPSRPA